MRWGDDAHPALADARYDFVLASDVTYGHDSHQELAATLRTLLLSSSERPPRIVLSHEHRERERGLREQLKRWDEGDPLLEQFTTAASTAGLAVVPLWSR